MIYTKLKEAKPLKTENIILVTAGLAVIYFLTKKKEATVISNPIINPTPHVTPIISPIGSVTTILPTPITGGVMPSCIKYKFLKDIEVQSLPLDCFAAPCPQQAAPKKYKAGDVICGLYKPPIVNTCMRDNPDSPCPMFPDFAGSLQWSDGGVDYVIYGDDAVQMATATTAQTNFTGKDFYSFAGDFHNIKNNWS